MAQDAHEEPASQVVHSLTAVADNSHPLNGVAQDVQAVGGAHESSSDGNYTDLWAAAFPSLDQDLVSSLRMLNRWSRHFTCAYFSEDVLIGRASGDHGAQLTWLA